MARGYRDQAMSDTTEARVFATTLADLVRAGAIRRDEAHTDRAAIAVRRSFAYQSALLSARLGELGQRISRDLARVMRSPRGG